MKRGARNKSDRQNDQRSRRQVRSYTFHHREDGEGEDDSVLSVLSVGSHDDEMNASKGGRISRESQIVLHVLHAAHEFRDRLGAAFC